jgi:hypothetical protein
VCRCFPLYGVYFGSGYLFEGYKMTTILTPSSLPDLFLTMHSAKDEADALKIANGRRAWIYRNALGALVVFVEKKGIE